MSLSIEANAPRCFGLASTYGADDEICGQCFASDQCGVLAKSNLEELKKLIEVGNIGKMHSVSSSSNKTPVMAPESIEIHGMMSRGENPFSPSHKPAFLRPAVNLILAGSASKQTIIDMLTGDFDMTSDKAEKSYKILSSTLIKTGIVMDIDNILKVKEKL